MLPMPKTNPTIEERNKRRAEDFHRRLEALVDKKTREGKADEITDGAISRATDIDRSTVTRILNGDRPANADHILAIAKGLGAPELIPEEMKFGGLSVVSGESARVSPPVGKLPPGLEGFLGRHAKKLHITRRERRYLERDRTETEDWLVKDDGHWERRLKFWREELAIQDKTSGAPSEEDS